MGYSEIPCKLCGTSFNISRIRRADEPYYTAWRCGESFPHDELRQLNFISSDREFFDIHVSMLSDGCQTRLRRLLSVDYDTDDEDDGDYVDRDASDSEQLEYDSGEDASDYSMDDESAFEDVTSEKEQWDSTYLILSNEVREVDPDCTDSHGIEDPHGKYCQSKMHKDGQGGGDGGGDTDDYGRWCPANLLEHLAGPNCAARTAYTGNRISAEEMRGCTTSQCLIRKSSDWMPEADDQDFELSSNYFLSGVAVHMPSRDDRCPKFIPQRHGAAREVHADIIMWPYDNEVDKPVPFHPTCFETFIRASRKRVGNIDINGLMGWRNLESSFQSNCEFPRHPAVSDGGQQEWNHEPGNEWLAANPVFIPGLEDLLWSAAREPIIDDDQIEPMSKDGIASQQSLKDPFAILPRELADAILSFLEPVDIASLRLAPCARYLPISDWKTRLEKDMPWLWEVWDDVEPNLWARVTHAEVQAAIKAKEQAYDEFQYQGWLYTTAIQEEMPEIWEAWIHDNSWLNQAPSSDWRSYLALMSNITPSKPLPQIGTNWCRIYYEVSKHGEGLKGLRNRQRIWTDVEEILERISKYRYAGMIGE